MSIEESFLKAAEGQAQNQAPQGQAQVQAPDPVKLEPSDKAQTTPAAPDSPDKDKDKREWDGKPETLASELKQDPKAIQRAYSRKAMALAEAEKKLKEFDGFTKEEFDAYRNWKQQQEIARQQQLVQQPPAPTKLTAEQWEYLKGNPEAMQAYIDSTVQNQINAAAQQLLPQIQQVQYEQQVNHWERVIADFGEVHPDMWEMHEAGLFSPILDDTVKNGGTLEDAYGKASQIWGAMQAKAEATAQKSVQQKREGSSVSGAISSDDDTIFAENASDALNKAFDLAYTKKEFVPKDAMVSPRGKVRTRK